MNTNIYGQDPGMQRAPASWWHIIGLLTAVALLTIVLHWACGGAVVPVAFLG